MSTPQQDGFRQPAEDAPHAACWLAWPSHAELWKENLPEAQSSFASLCKAIADVEPATGKARGEALEVLVPTAAAESDARASLASLPVRFHRIEFGDIWLRDTAPIFVTRPDGTSAAVRFGFNGWGGKYQLPEDDRVAARIAEASGLPTYHFPLVLEGGSVEVDGEGTLLTTRQCLLNPNRNPGVGQAELERILGDALGVSRVLWLGDGLLNDHTDGHIDTVARFVAPGRVVCMKPSGKDDPNAAVLEQMASDLRGFRDARGRTLDVIQVPSPGRLEDEEGRVLPASYVNFYVGNTTVVVPTYGSVYDASAVAALAQLFPGRRTVGVPALAILSGGGAFHCITQQQPGRAR